MKLHVYFAVVFLFTQNGYSQRQGEPCVIKHTNTPGICTPATTCQSALRDYKSSGIPPTFCIHSQTSKVKTLIICCSDQSSILNKSQNNTPVWFDNQQTTNDNKRLSEKSKKYFDYICPDFRTYQCTYKTYLRYCSRRFLRPRKCSVKAAIGWVNFDGTYSFLCGGSLISTNYVLTAAHCTKHSKIRDPIPVIVRLGEQNLDQTVNDSASLIEVPIKSIRKHPQYKSPYKYHDIALLELASDVNFDVAIKPACLWSKPDFSGHTEAVATGWGAVDPRTLRTSNDLQKVSLSLLENEHCNYLLRTKKNRLWAVGFIENQMCAGELGGGKDTCQGDSGSPLQVISHENKSVIHIIGITSFGYKCSQSGTPAVYTRVSSYLDWIESVVWPVES